jgi:O-antigen/teichoic acid export membrane protein
MNSDEAAVSSLRQGAALSALTSGVVDATARVLTVLLSVVAARVLGPTDVGTLGIAVTIVAILSMVGSFWETAGVIAGHSSPGADAAYAAAATILRTLIACALVGVGLMSSPAIVSLLTSTPAAAEHLSALLWILLWTPLTEALACHPRVILQRRLDLRYLAWLQLLAAVLFVGGALALLQQGFGTAGVAWSQVASGVAIGALTWVRLGPDRWSGWPPAEAWRAVCLETWRLFAGGFLSFLATRTDNMLVAGAIGETGMGFYSMAYNASRLPLNTLEKVTSFVLVPTLARIRGDAARVQNAVDEALRHFYLAVVPASVALLVSAPSLVDVVLGARWLPLVPCLRVMCLTVVAAPALYTAGALLVALGRAHWLGVGSAALLALQVLAIPPMARRFGPLGAAFVDLAVVILLTAGVSRAAQGAMAVIRWRLGATLILPALAGSCAGLLAWGACLFPMGKAFLLVTQLAVIAVGYPLFVWAAGGGDRLRAFLSLLPVGYIKRRAR